MNRAGRIARVREQMGRQRVDVLLLSVGADLPYLTGYEAMPLPRLTMLVLPVAGDARLVVPRLEAPRVHGDGSFEIVPWPDGDDPVAIVASMIAGARTIAVDEKTHKLFLPTAKRAPQQGAGRAAYIPDSFKVLVIGK